MRLLQVIHSTNPAGGGPIEAALQIESVLSEMGHRSAIASLDARDVPWIKDMNGKRFLLGPPFLHYGYSSRFTPWMRGHFEEYDAVIVHGIWQYSSYGTWRALNKSNTPYFVCVHGMLDPWFKRKYTLKHIKKCLYWPWAEYKVLRDARAVFYCCEQERLLAHQSFRIYKCREEVICYYGTALPPGDKDAKKEIFLKRFPNLRGKRLILFLSRIHPKKGCDLLIKSFAGISKEDPSLRLVMAGPDQIGWQRQLQSLSKKLGNYDKITWAGMLTGDLKWGAFYASEIFILPSHQENFGVAIAEALACGVPVLITDKINISREIKADGAAFIGNDDVKSITELLERWLALPPNEYEAMKEKARQCFLKRYEIHKSVGSVVEVLRTYGADG
ncbi:MAG: glycosyltransferase [Candidatus Omnitrophica bacterium]|nr:glycosyltransferase [Candidatus Omnitrophota bacterium]